MTVSTRVRRVLVTGGAGFIGSHIVEGLLDRGHEVRVLDNFVTGKRENLERLGNGLYKSSDFEVIEGDIRDIAVVRGACKGVDVVLHQAALGSVPRSVEDPATTQAVNADGALNVFWAAVQEGTRRVVYASSSSVYGDSEALPKKEGSEGAPLSPYALTKKNNEEYAFLCARLYGLETVGLRYFNIYGPRQDPDSQYAAVIPRFVAALTAGTPPTIYGTGKQTRDFTYVKDAVSANLAAMETPGITAAAVNIGRGSGAGVLEILDIIKELLGVHIEPRFDPPRAGDVMHSTADIQAALNLLGFTAQYTLQAGLDETIAWYKENL